MIPEKRIIRRIQSGGCAIHCQDCSISQLCIPFTLNEHELDQLDNIIERKKPIQKGQTLFKAGDELKSLYAIRSGTIKAIPSPSKVMSGSLASIWRATWWALTPSAPVCTRALRRRWKPRWSARSPSETLDDLSGKMPNLRQQMMRLMAVRLKATGI